MFVTFYKWFADIVSEEKGFRISLAILSFIFWLNPSTLLHSEAQSADRIPAVIIVAVGVLLTCFSVFLFRSYMAFPILFIGGAVKALILGQLIEFGFYMVVFIVLTAVFAKIRKEHAFEEFVREHERKKALKEPIKVDKSIYRNPENIPKGYDSRFDDF